MDKRSKTKQNLMDLVFETALEGKHLVIKLPGEGRVTVRVSNMCYDGEGRPFIESRDIYGLCHQFSLKATSPVVVRYATKQEVKRYNISQARNNR